MVNEESALLVPVFVADCVVGPLRAQLDPAAKLGVPAHITVLYPFVAPDAVVSPLLDELRSLFQRVAAFDFVLTRTAWFGETVLWLAPEPDVGFRRLTTAAFSRWPQYPPYGGRFAELTPHLTIGDGAPLDSLRDAELEVAPALPIAARATEVVLMSGGTEPGSWKTHARFPLGDAS
jgi:2'-5' RNA ligase